MTETASFANDDDQLSDDQLLEDPGGVPFDDDLDEEEPDVASTRGGLAHDSGTQLVARGIAYPKAVPVGMIALKKFIMAPWGGMDLGILAFEPRTMRGGNSPSLHNWGMAWDWRFANPGRGRQSADAAIELLLDNAGILGIQAIHDYSEGRLWKSYQGEWRPGTTSTKSGMGIPANQWLHIERTWAAANDKRSIEETLKAGGASTAPVTSAKPDDRPGTMVLPDPEIVEGEEGVHVAQLQDFLRKYGYAKYTRSDGKFQTKTVAAVQAAQEDFTTRGWYTKKIDGKFGPLTAEAAKKRVAESS